MRSYLFSQVTGLLEPLGVTNYAERRSYGSFVLSASRAAVISSCRASW